MKRCVNSALLMASLPIRANLPLKPTKPGKRAYNPSVKKLKQHFRVKHIRNGQFQRYQHISPTMKSIMNQQDVTAIKAVFNPFKNLNHVLAIAWGHAVLQHRRRNIRGERLKYGKAASAGRKTKLKLSRTIKLAETPFSKWEFIFPKPSMAKKANGKASSDIHR